MFTLTEHELFKAARFHDVIHDWNEGVYSFKQYPTNELGFPSGNQHE
jgi:hypothetical protein